MGKDGHLLNMEVTAVHFGDFSRVLWLCRTENAEPGNGGSRWDCSFWGFFVFRCLFQQIIGLHAVVLLSSTRFVLLVVTDMPVSGHSSVNSVLVYLQLPWRTNPPNNLNWIIPGQPAFNIDYLLSSPPSCVCWGFFLFLNNWMEQKLQDIHLQKHWSSVWN